jgi:hypothetical protein
MQITCCGLSMNDEATLAVVGDLAGNVNVYDISPNSDSNDAVFSVNTM